MDEADAAVFHEGERAVQARVGVRDRIEEIGRRVIRDFMPDQHREFFALLPFVVVGGIDASQQPWASVLAGPPGFVHSPDPKQLVIEAQPTAPDPLAGAFMPGAAIGLLGIQPHTRRRNRMNGRILDGANGALRVAVSQSFGNCPKYIQAREPTYVGPRRDLTAVHGGDRLDADAQALVRAADTFFIATAHPGARAGSSRSEGVDVSHRGGKPGFVDVQTDGQRLAVPDFVGNDLFNTIGNLLLEPRAGLLFVDFATGDLLHVAVRGSVVWDGPQVRAFEGAQRVLAFEVTAWRRLEAGLPLRWTGGALSPFLGPTGAWPAEPAPGR